MALFETSLLLMLAAILLLQISRRWPVPYPTMLAMAGVAVAAMPWVPPFEIEPRLALALFIAPALFDAAYDFPPRALLRYWLPLLALAAIAVLLTTGAVATAAVWFGGLPVAAAIALGAIVAPPDAAAASAVLGRFTLPRSTLTVLEGESLFNDAVALLIFTWAVTTASSPGLLNDIAPLLVLEAPAGIVLGIVFAKLYVYCAPRLAGTLGGTLFEFVMTFGVWVVADRLHLSAILAVVTFAMMVARDAPDRQAARDRLHSYSVWGATVFMLNVLAFLLMGMQARTIVGRLAPGELGHAMLFAGGVLVIVIVVRIVWVMLYNRGMAAWARAHQWPDVPSTGQGLLVSWSGMRGLVTLATALALPGDFPARDLIVLSALTVVLGTLVLQGLTLGPLIRRLNFPKDDGYDTELVTARRALLDAALATLGDRQDIAAKHLRKAYQAEHAVEEGGHQPGDMEEIDALRHKGIEARRNTLSRLRRSGRIDESVFHALELELDWAEVAAMRSEETEIVQG
ncbi:cation:proton antiporter [Pigmentiphaga litoralis]|uniref:CPA1 family monovalent cation:H+ antiporter n=1 Tax=Pigmentiphaga litoralis TaxID=516702 RepID=A0A7Y9LP69_9BURK|nr:sodium:proton antiporter [Pigmentiphaga litoralis]NYE22282.1 CPA1 family monovalent cation:H+ antiporter [Pigmentiphaga litoralis]NYE84103.1 CPA1 family monovalent cation:H+ antiporter [Pigmentiphaga litoralis]